MMSFFLARMVQKYGSNITAVGPSSLTRTGLNVLFFFMASVIKKRWAHWKSAWLKTGGFAVTQTSGTARE